MEDIRSIIAKNISELRKSHGMTQIELAERLNYSDKAVSKWERGESVPDIAVLKAISDTFHVTVDYLISAEHEEPDLAERESAQQTQIKKKRAHRVITAMSVLLVWVIATLVFVILDAAAIESAARYLTFVYAVPVSMIVWLVFNSLWHDVHRNYLIISALMWSMLVSVYLSVLAGGFDFWQLFLLGIPGQVIILLWSFMRPRK